MPYLDMRMLYSRSDAHVNSLDASQNDCLHLCAPGPLDVVGRVFHNFLLEIDTRTTTKVSEGRERRTSHELRFAFNPSRRDRYFSSKLSSTSTTGGAAEMFA